MAFWESDYWDKEGGGGSGLSRWFGGFESHGKSIAEEQNKLASAELKDLLFNKEGGLEHLKRNPIYQARLRQGEESLRRQQASRGLGGSGQEMREMMDYGQTAASGELNNYIEQLMRMMGAGREQSQLFNQNVGGAAEGVGKVMGSWFGGKE